MSVRIGLSLVACVSPLLSSSSPSSHSDSNRSPDSIPSIPSPFSLSPGFSKHSPPSQLEEQLQSIQRESVAYRKHADELIAINAERSKELAALQLVCIPALEDVLHSFEACRRIRRGSRQVKGIQFIFASQLFRKSLSQ